LDVGTGTGTAARAALDSVSGNAVVGVDPAREMLRRASGDGLQLACASCPGLPFPPETFAAVVANLVLSHFPDRDAALCDMVRVLRPGGRFGATAWAETSDEPDADAAQGTELINAALADFKLAREPPEPAAPGEEWLRVKANLHDVLASRGLTDISSRVRTYTRHRQPDEYLDGQLWGGRGRYLQSVSDPATWDDFRGVALDRLQQRFPVGLTTDSRLRIVTATKPRPSR
jgi:SAM-dependent methyltransferase